ncbi:transporter substrate-binding domain-containing protein [Chitinivorax sp. B]|uniref:substrate-binding periplasmic protein n=1 Tax=Chitinivorax sp. B TaxID=2502235 RepID=UPI001485382E|nr:transporter substrate-binding domain-containing protein [Chitinivorax sp. B]
MLSLALPAKPIQAEPVKTVHLVTSAYPPYFGPTLPNEGVISEIVREAFRRSGYHTKLEFLPWTRCLAYAKNGRVDGLFGVWYLKERESFLMYSDPMPPIQLGFYTRTDTSIQFQSFEDLRPYVIGTVQSYGDPPNFVAAKLTTDPAPDDKHNLIKLGAGRVDLILIEKGVAQYLITNELPHLGKQLIWIDPPIATMLQYVALSLKAPRAKALREAFNKGLQSMTNDGLLKQMIDQSGVF